MEYGLKRFFLAANEEAVSDFSELLSVLERCIRCVDRCFDQEVAFDRKDVDFAKYFFMQSGLRLAKEAYNAVLSGSFNGAAGLCRCLIENYVCCALIMHYPEEPLSALWELHSLKSKEKELKDKGTVSPELWEAECDRLGLDSAVLEKKEFQRDYGWAYPVVKNLNFKGLTEAVNPSIYQDYRYFCNYSHGTSLLNMRFSFTFYDDVLPLFANLFYYFTSITELYYNGAPNREYAALCFRFGKEYHRACKKAGI